MPSKYDDYANLPAVAPPDAASVFGGGGMGYGPAGGGYQQPGGPGGFQWPEHDFGALGPMHPEAFQFPPLPSGPHYGHQGPDPMSLGQPGVPGLEPLPPFNDAMLERIHSLDYVPGIQGASVVDTVDGPYDPPPPAVGPQPIGDPILEDPDDPLGIGDPDMDMIDRELANQRRLRMRELEEFAASRGLVGSSVEMEQVGQLGADLERQREQFAFDLRRENARMELERRALDLRERGMDRQSALDLINLWLHYELPVGEIPEWILEAAGRDLGDEDDVLGRGDAFGRRNVWRRHADRARQQYPAGF